jgi:hypothetical protein
MDQAEQNSKPKPKILKFLFFIIIIIAFFGIIFFVATFDFAGITTEKEKTTEEKDTMEITGENKAQSYNSFIIDEWNGYRFRYQSGWSVKKNYNEDGSFSGVTIYPQTKKADNDYISIGSGKKNCEDFGMVKCSMSGYGLIIQPIYTYSSDSEVAIIYDGIIKSIDTFQGKNEFDIEKIRNIINIFIEAEKNSDFNKARKVMSTELLNSYDSRYFSSAREGKIGRYEFVENAKYLDTGYYQIPTKVYGYLTDAKNEIGYWNYIFKIKIINSEYLIDDITINSFQSK